MLECDGLLNCDSCSRKQCFKYKTVVSFDVLNVKREIDGRPPRANLTTEKPLWGVFNKSSILKFCALKLNHELAAVEKTCTKRLK